MELRALARVRLRNQHLAGAPLPTPEAVVGWFGAVQAQDYPGAKWSIGQRASGVRDEDLDLALASGSLVRTHVLRPTWHVVLPSDLRWLLELTGPRIHAGNRTQYRQLELDEPTANRARAILEAGLSGGRKLTRREVGELMARQGIVLDGFRLTYILMRAELEGVVCSGGLKGRQQTYALFDERVPRGSLQRDEALAELVRRYFRGHGPATLRDFTWWSSLTVADARRGLELAGDGLELHTWEGRRYWSAPGAAVPATDPPRAHLLQGFDEYLVAYRESKHVFLATGLLDTAPIPRPPLTHAIVMDGQLVGHWQRRLGARPPAIEVRCLRSLAAGERAALDREIERYAGFIGQPLRFSDASD
ncbi:MAG TPA: winged helix DNA-binding domain-containing protein [Candidatus Dormibacteraeota bacterium]|nr:winged helix DNA-binding domain-containing protein [Candidatus Dormibacteraeota bacterium]